MHRNSPGWEDGTSFKCRRMAAHRHGGSRCARPLCSPFSPPSPPPPDFPPAGCSDDPTCVRRDRLLHTRTSPPAAYCCLLLYTGCVVLYIIASYYILLKGRWSGLCSTHDLVRMIRICLVFISEKQALAAYLCTDYNNTGMIRTVAVILAASRSSFLMTKHIRIIRTKS